MAARGADLALAARAAAQAAVGLGDGVLDGEGGFDLVVLVTRGDGLRRSVVASLGDGLLIGELVLPGLVEGLALLEVVALDVASHRGRGAVTAGDGLDHRGRSADHVAAGEDAGEAGRDVVTADPHLAAVGEVAHPAGGQEAEIGLLTHRGEHAVGLEDELGSRDGDRAPSPALVGIAQRHAETLQSPQRAILDDERLGGDEEADRDSLGQGGIDLLLVGGHLLAGAPVQHLDPVRRRGGARCGRPRSRWSRRR